MSLCLCASVVNLRINLLRGKVMPQLSPTVAWEPWLPSAGDPWSLKWAGHLYRRAAFGGTWAELQEALRAGPGATIDRLLEGAEGHEAFDAIMDELAPEGGRGFQFQ